MISLDQTQLANVVPSHNAATAMPVAANSMPSLRQTGYGLEAVGEGSASHKEYGQRPLTVISHPRHAPSAITSEQFVNARAAMAPGFIHQTAASKAARISNLYADTPRFSQQIDILA